MLWYVGSLSIFYFGIWAQKLNLSAKFLKSTLSCSKFLIFPLTTFADISSSATVVYRTPQAALHARQKLHGFEYPPGERLIVKLSSELKNFPLLDGPSQVMFDNNASSNTFCSVNLPPVQPVSKETTVAQRCFIVCSPHSLPVHVLKQVFCRFGNLIDVYLLNNRNCGYVKYATAESAKQVTCNYNCDNNQLIMTNNVFRFPTGDEHFARRRDLRSSLESTRSRRAIGAQKKIATRWLNCARQIGNFFSVIVHCIHTHILKVNLCWSIIDTRWGVIKILNQSKKCLRMSQRSPQLILFVWHKKDKIKVQRSLNGHGKVFKKLEFLIY